MLSAKHWIDIRCCRGGGYLWQKVLYNVYMAVYNLVRLWENPNILILCVHLNPEGWSNFSTALGHKYVDSMLSAKHWIDIRCCRGGGYLWQKVLFNVYMAVYNLVRLWENPNILILCVHLNPEGWSNFSTALGHKYVDSMLSAKHWIDIRCCRGGGYLWQKLLYNVYMAVYNWVIKPV